MANSSTEQPIHNPQNVKDYDAERRKRAARLFHWSLDMPPGEDDMQVNVRKTGLDWKSLAVIVGGLLGGSYLVTKNAADNVVTPSVIEQEDKVIRKIDRERVELLPPVVRRP